MATEPGRPTVERCREHLAALYVLAYLCLGNPDAAQDAVVEAVVNINLHPVAAIAGPPWIWHVLATDIQARRHEATSDRPSLGRSVGLSFSQQEALALVVSGRKASEAARLLGISNAHLYRDLRTGLKFVHTALQSSQLMEVSG